MKHFIKPLDNERGVAMPLLAVTMMVIVGFTALGVDVGRIGLVADEVQNAADIAATAAAMQLVQPDPNDLAASPRDHAEQVLAENKIDNTTVGSSHLTVLETGNFNAGTFTANLAPINAVRAEVQYTVNNIVFAGLGHPTSLVTKESIAAFAPAAGGQPTIPLAIGECLLGDNCNSQSCDVTLTQIPNPDDNSAWTGFFETSSTAQIDHYFPSECDGDDPSTVPTIHVGDDISLLNGQSNLLRQVQCMLDNGLTEVLVPITTCGGSLNQTREVLGFARFEIIAVRTNGQNKGIDIQGLTSAIDGPPGGPNDFGAGKITMVR
jgi:hypothetical protein